MHQLCFLYMLNYPVIYLLSQRERERLHMYKELCLPRLKIVPIIKNLYRIQCQCVDELSKNNSNKKWMTLLLFKRR